MICGIDLLRVKGDLVGTIEKVVMLVVHLIAILSQIALYFDTGLPACNQPAVSQITGCD